LRHGVTAAG